MQKGVTYTFHLGDIVDGEGDIWETRKNLIEVGSKSVPHNNQKWLRFTGRWGSSMGGPFIFGSKSPDTPSFKKSWRDDGAGPLDLENVDPGSPRLP